MMQELNVTHVQLDELWTFVRKKERMLKEWEKLPSYVFLRRSFSFFSNGHVPLLARKNTLLL